MEMRGDEHSRRSGPVIVQAGRRIDAEDAASAKFPLASVPVVRQRIKEVFAREKPAAFVSAAACGTDLLALDVAAELDIRRAVLLPSPPDKFRETSVIDRPGNWGALFDRLKEGVTLEVASTAEGQESYLETNLKLLDRAEQIAATQKTDAIALVVWDGQSRGSGDVTGHFLENARKRKLRVIEISTL